MVLWTPSPGTKAVQKKAQKAVVVQAVCDLINQCDECGSSYGILPKISTVGNT